MQNRAFNSIKLVSLSAALLLGASLLTQSFAASEIRIQRYDKDGNVVGVDRARNSVPTGAQAGKSDGQDNGIEPDSILAAGPAHQIKTAARALGLSVTGIDTLSALDLTVAGLKVPRGQTADDVLAAIQKHAPGLTSDYNHLFVEAVGKTDTPRGFMGWPRSTAQCGTGARIGMIDGSVDAAHPAFEGRDLVAISFIGNRHDPGSHDHGTAVASILIGGPDWGGILPGARLYAANIFYEKKSGKRAASARALTKALNWLLDSDVQVINLSISGPDNAVIRKIVEAAARRSIVMVAAAGNGGRKAAPAYPAAYDETIAVTALNHDAKIYTAANQGPYIDFAMPGVRVWAAVPGGGRYQNGTSFAAPFVTALAAAEMANGAEGSPASLRKLLIPNTVDLGQPGKDSIFGHGFIKQPPRCFAMR